MSLTTEGQHLIDSLEAHLNAVKAAVVSADAALIAHVDAVWDEARSAIENFRAKLDGALGNSVEPTAAPVATEALSTAASTGSEVAGSATAGAVEAAGTVSNEITGEGASALTQESQPGAETAAEKAA